MKIYWVKIYKLKMDIIDLDSEEFDNLSNPQRELLLCIKNSILSDNDRIKLLEMIITLLRDKQDSSNSIISKLIKKEEKLLEDKNYIENELFNQDELIIIMRESIEVKNKKIRMLSKTIERLSKPDTFIYSVLVFQLFMLYLVFNF